MPDRKEYIEVLSKAAKTVKEYNEDTPIRISLESIEDILELLKEQKPVLCKECEYFNDYFAECEKNNHTHGAAWYCADGKCKEGRL